MDWQTVMLEPAKTLIAQIGQFLVYVLLFIITLIVGWVISRGIKALVSKLLKAVKVDSLSDMIKLNQLLEKGGIKYRLSDLIGIIFYWLALLITVVVALNIVNLTVAADLLQRIVLYVPNVIAAVFILIAGMFIATLLGNIVQTAANNAGLSQTNFLSSSAKFIVMIFAVFITLEQLNIGAKIVELTIGILLGSIGLGFAIAFGLGCKDLVGKGISDILDKFKKK